VGRHNDNDTTKKYIDYSGRDWYEPRKPPIGYTIPIRNNKTERVINDNEYNQSNDLLSFDLNGTVILFPKQLEEIVVELNDSKYIYEIGDNWDGNGAAAIDSNTYRNSLQLLIDYSLALYNVHGVVMDCPEINPCVDGSIDISWRTKLARLLINIKSVNGVTKVLFYRDHHYNKQSNKGELSLDTIDESFLVWMKYLK